MICLWDIGVFIIQDLSMLTFVLFVFQLSLLFLFKKNIKFFFICHNMEEKLSQITLHTDFLLKTAKNQSKEQHRMRFCI